MTEDGAAVDNRGREGSLWHHIYSTEASVSAHVVSCFNNEFTDTAAMPQGDHHKQGL